MLRTHFTIHSIVLLTLLFFNLAGAQQLLAETTEDEILVQSLAQHIADLLAFNANKSDRTLSDSTDAALAEKAHRYANRGNDMTSYLASLDYLEGKVHSAIATTANPEHNWNRYLQVLRPSLLKDINLHLSSEKETSEKRRRKAVGVSIAMFFGPIILGAIGQPFFDFMWNRAGIIGAFSMGLTSMALTVTPFIGMAAMVGLGGPNQQLEESHDRATQALTTFGERSNCSHTFNKVGGAP